MVKSEVKNTEEAKTPTSVPQIWSNLLQWCNPEVRNQMKRANSRPHECKTCGKRFTLLENLNRHQMIHTNQRPFHCPYCSKSFRLSQHLKEHIRIHTGEKPYKCHICGHAFCQISNLKSHQKTHTKVKGFRCDQCGKEFRRSFTLKQHKLTHSKTQKAKEVVKTDQIAKPGIDTTPMKQDAAATTTTSDDIINLSRNQSSESTKDSQLCKNQSKNETASVVNGQELNGTTNFRSLWNSLHHGNLNKNAVLPRDTNYPGRDKSLSDYAHMSKMFGFANSASMKQLQEHLEKYKPKSLEEQSIPQLGSWALCQSSHPSLSQSLVGRSKNSTCHVTFSSSPFSNALKSSSETINSLSVREKEKTNYENTTRKRKQTQSLHEPASASSTFFDGFSPRSTDLVPRTHQPKPLTLSQDYNWKRQLYREWQESWTDDKPSSIRSVSAELARGQSSNNGFSKPESFSKLHERPTSKENLNHAETKAARASSIDDDVFSPLPAGSGSLATPRNVKSSNSTSTGSAFFNPRFSLSSSKVFHFPDTSSPKRMKQESMKSESLSNSSTSSVIKTEEKKSLSYFPVSNNNLSPFLFQNYLSGSLLQPPHNSPHHAAPNYKNTLSTYDDSFPNDKLTPSPNYSPSTPLFDFSPSHYTSERFLPPKLPLSPDLKSLSGHISFVPLVTWKPIVTGWKNMADGNVYPARFGVDNLNPFSLQQTIS